MKTKTYLGDSVYADLDPRNVIVLEPEVLDSLLTWLKSIK